VDLEPSNLNEVIRDAAISMKGELKDRKLEVQSDDRLPPISMDRRLMKLAIKQILDNALKYSPLEAAVAVHAFRGDGTVALEITDHGKGISREEQLRIFERFYRSPSIRNQIPGSGLGLSIAHRILRAHGGDLTVKSSPGETTFRLVLPVEPA
jgi:two-component system sensor histidine kinase SenX3